MNIAGYRIEKQIGKGGMAMVYLAVQESLNRPVALKIMNPLFSDTPEFSERFINEGRILASIHHSNIITIHDIGISEGLHYISMEYVEGGDLADRIKQGIPEDEAVDIIRTMASCLGAAHDKHIVHRDLKPVNILIRKDGGLLLTDFGIAKQLGANQDLTATGSMVGSPHYLSPEQAQGKPVDGRADIYSLGIIFYELLTGKRPFTGDSEVDIAIKHITQELPALPDNFARYTPVISCMTQKDPNNRFPSTQSLLNALIELQNGEDWSGNIAPIPLPDPPGPGNVTAPNLELPRTNNKPSTEKTLAGNHTATLPEADVPTMPDGPALTQTQATQTIQDNPPAKSRGLKAIVLVVGIILLLGAGLLLAPQLVPYINKDTAPRAVQPRSTPEKAPPPEPRAVAPRKDDEERLRQQQRQRQVRAALTKAQSALADYRLTTPANDNAYDYYREALRLDPDNKTALQGFDQIADSYHKLARSAVDKWDYDQARHLVKTGLEVRPEHKDLLKLRAELRKKDGEFGRDVKNSLKGVKGWFD